MNLRKWNIYFRWEIAIVILLWWGMAIFNIVKVHLATAGLCIVVSILPVLVLAFNWLKKKSAVTRWLAIIIMPAILSVTWYILFHNILCYVSFKLGIIVLFGLILLVMDLPVAVVAIGQMQNWLGRLIAACYFDTVLLSSTAIELKPQGINVLISSGLMAGVAAFLAAMLIAKCWGFSFNPDLKWQKSSNWSNVTFILLLLFCIVFAFWAEFCEKGNNLVEILFKPDFGPLKPTWASFCRALEAGVFEETNRYLTILALIVGFANSKYRVQITVIVSAVVFGLLHFTNLGGQDFAATLNQVIYAAALGLVLAILYLYTGKLWLPMLLSLWR